VEDLVVFIRSFLFPFPPNAVTLMRITSSHFMYKIVVFSKTHCPYCTDTKNLFSKLNITIKVHELDRMSNGSEIQSTLLEMTNQRTVPNVFINGKHVGGNGQ
jgi:glutaredoxin 3